MNIVTLPPQSAKTSPVSDLEQKPATLPTDANKQAVLRDFPERPTDFILRAQIDAAFDEITWRGIYSKHTWLDLWFDGDDSNG